MLVENGHKVQICMQPLRTIEIWHTVISEYNYFNSQNTFLRKLNDILATLPSVWSTF